MQLFVQQLGASWPPLFASDEQVMAILGKEFPKEIDGWETRLWAGGADCSRPPGAVGRGGGTIGTARSSSW